MQNEIKNQVLDNTLMQKIDMKPSKIYNVRY